MSSIIYNIWSRDRKTLLSYQSIAFSNTIHRVIPRYNNVILILYRMDLEYFFFDASRQSHMRKLIIHGINRASRWTVHTERGAYNYIIIFKAVVVLAHKMLYAYNIGTR